MPLGYKFSAGGSSLRLPAQSDEILAGSVEQSRKSLRRQKFKGLLKSIAPYSQNPPALWTRAAFVDKVRREQVSKMRYQ
jgi:hypothetical protein